MDYFKKFDFYGKNVSLFYGSSTIHRTIFGGLLSLFTFSLITMTTIYSLYSFLYQKPVINSNIVFFINKKFAQLKGMEISGQLTLDIPEEMSDKYININGTYSQLDDFLKYYRIVLHEKYFEEVERYRVAKITRVDNKTYQFNVEMHISDVFKEKDFSSLKIISCEELAKKESIANIIWPKSENIEDPDYEITNFKEDIKDMSNFDNSPEMCYSENNKYFENLKNYNLENIDFIFSFDTPIYTVDIKGEVRKPGVYTLKKGKRVIDVVKTAGGLTLEADTSANNLSMKITDEMVIIIYSNSQVEDFSKTKEIENQVIDYCNQKDENSLHNDACISKDNNTPTGKISLSNATLEELMTLPGVGESKAKNIIEYRASNGPFITIEDVMKVSGIGEGLFDQIKEYITP